MQNVNKESVIRYVGESKQQVIDSRDVAKMIGKTHKNLMRDIRSYISDLEPGSKLSPAKFFIESTYVDQNNQERPCFLLTKQGCEFVANKLTGRKGTIFTATYVSLFNEYEAEHNGKVAAIDNGLEHEKLAYKREWLIEMRKQNVNKHTSCAIKTSSCIWSLAKLLTITSDHVWPPTSATKQSAPCRHCR